MNYQEAIEQSPYNLAIRKGKRNINVIDSKGTTFIYENNKWRQVFSSYDFTKLKDWNPLKDPNIYKNLNRKETVEQSIYRLNLNWMEAVEQSDYKLAYRCNVRSGNIVLIDSNGTSYTNFNGTYIKARKTARLKSLKDWQPLTDKEIYNQFTRKETKSIKEKGIISQTKLLNNHINSLIDQVDKLSNMTIGESMLEHLDNINVNIEIIKELL